MPVILPTEQIQDWLDSKDGSYGQDSGFKHHPVKLFGMKDDARI